MKKVIFVCLLSLAVGFSKPATENGPNNVATNVTPQQGGVQEKTPPGSSTVAAQGTPPQTPDQKAKEAPAVTPSPAIPPTPTVTPIPVTEGNGTHGSTTTPTKAPSTAQVINSTTNTPQSDNKATNGTNGQTSSTEAPHVVPDNSKLPTNSSDGVKPTEKPGPVTESTAKSSTTVKPTDDATKADAKVQSRSFDGPSFIGGIILTLGLIAVGFIGFKYYKTKLNGNYRAF